MRYIGSKKLLLGDIEQVIDENIDSAKVFCDIFSGTVCVANYFKKKYRIISNDLMFFSYCIQKGIIENNSVPQFSELGFNPVEYFNNLTIEEMEKLPKAKRFCVNNYSPVGNRMYLTENNALRIDYIRNKINDWNEKKQISDSEFYYLLAVLIEAIPFVSNISGTYGAYNKFWDRRALKDIILKDLEVSVNEYENKAFNEDGNELIRKISGDILYIDPPYNKRQYSSNYHLIETIAKYDSPVLKGVTGLRQNDKKSEYCKKNSVLNSLKDLVENAKFRHIILSYNTEGILKVNELEMLLKSVGSGYKLYEIPYRRYKSRETAPVSGLKELIFYVRKDI